MVCVVAGVALGEWFFFFFIFFYFTYKARPRVTHGKKIEKKVNLVMPPSYIPLIHLHHSTALINSPTDIREALRRRPVLPWLWNGWSTSGQRQPWNPSRTLPIPCCFKHCIMSPLSGCNNRLPHRTPPECRSQSVTPSSVTLLPPPRWRDRMMYDGRGRWSVGGWVGGCYVEAVNEGVWYVPEVCVCVCVCLYVTSHFAWKITNIWISFRSR